MPIRVDDPRPPYLQLAEELRTAIRTGTYQPGDRLPSARQLARENGIALMTVQHAMKLLHEEGLVVSQQRRGVYVSELAGPAPEPPEASTPQTLDEALTMLSELQERMARLEAAGAPEHGTSADAGVDRTGAEPGVEP